MNRHSPYQSTMSANSNKLNSIITAHARLALALGFLYAQNKKQKLHQGKQVCYLIPPASWHSVRFWLTCPSLRILQLSVDLLLSWFLLVVTCCVVEDFSKPSSNKSLWLKPWSFYFAGPIRLQSLLGIPAWLTLYGWEPLHRGSQTSLCAPLLIQQFPASLNPHSFCLQAHFSDITPCASYNAQGARTSRDMPVVCTMLASLIRDLEVSWEAGKLAGAIFGCTLPYTPGA